MSCNWQSPKSEKRAVHNELKGNSLPRPFKESLYNKKNIK